MNNRSLLATRLFNSLWKFSILLFPLGILISACSELEPVINPPSKQEYFVPHGDGKPKNLATTGFNYTDLLIESFSVGTVGGGNIFVSSPTSGGGKTTCCISLYPGRILPMPLNIEWMRVVNGKDRWCKKTIQLNGPIPDCPTSLGVHFMPDGEIKVVVTNQLMFPILKLERFDADHRKKDGDIIYDEEKATCKNEH